MCAAGYKTAISACRAERTKNICFMVVTLEVSRFSDWSNADAPCRVGKGIAAAGCRVMGHEYAAACGKAEAKGSPETYPSWLSRLMYQSSAAG